MAIISVRSAVKNSVPISKFNKGLAGRIFADVRSNGPKVVMKNNAPECVLVSPEEYIALLDKLEDMNLLLLAEKRLKDSETPVIPQEKVLAELNISQNELDSMEDVEIE